jgi:RHS repeat-associated protein
MRKTAVSSGHRHNPSLHGAPGRTPWDARPVLEGTLSGDVYTTTAKYVWEGNSYYSPLMYSLIGGAWRYHFYDGLGSTRQLMLHASPYTVTDTYSYEAFGNLMSSSGTTPNPYRYVGSLGYYQTGNDLMHLGARYYMPEVGRFVQEDPSRQDANPYAYVASNPVLMTDASGLLTPDCGLCIACVTATIVSAAAGCIRGCWNSPCRGQCIITCLNSLLTQEFWDELPRITQFALGLCGSSCWTCGCGYWPGKPGPPKIWQPGDPYPPGGFVIE